MAKTAHVSPLKRLKEFASKHYIRGTANVERDLNKGLPLRISPDFFFSPTHTMQFPPDSPNLISTIKTGLLWADLIPRSFQYGNDYGVISINPENLHVRLVRAVTGLPTELDIYDNISPTALKLLFKLPSIDPKSRNSSSAVVDDVTKAEQYSGIARENFQLFLRQLFSPEEIKYISERFSKDGKIQVHKLRNAVRSGLILTATREAIEDLAKQHRVDFGKGSEADYKRAISELRQKIGQKFDEVLEQKVKEGRLNKKFEFI